MSALTSYRELLAKYLIERERGHLTEEEEDRYLEQLEQFWGAMTAEEKKEADR